MANTPQNTGAELERLADNRLRSAVDRRSFLRYTGATAVVGGLLLAGCGDDDDDTGTQPAVTLTTKLTNDDTGILNYAYALEQLEAAFYSEVVANHASLFTAAEQDTLKMIRDHEIIHREFFKAKLGNNRLADLTLDYSANGDNSLKIDLTTKAGILAGARKFEDLGVQAYNGAGQYIQNADYLLIAGKIVSVEARHAALLRDLIALNSFAADSQIGTVPPALTGGLEMSKKPSEVLPLVLPYVSQRGSLTSDLP